MTAPDPGLTDLIAAEIAKHQLDFGAMRHDDIRACTCGERVEEGYHSPHVASRVALVVEQHTNGRITELEAAVRKRIQLLREHDGFGAAHADGYMDMNWTAYYEGAYQAQVMAAADLENDLHAALEGEQQ